MKAPAGTREPCASAAEDPGRHRIMSCTDVATLDQWFDRALNATRLSEVLSDLAQ
jgi:hypothetical protein